MVIYGNDVAKFGFRFPCLLNLLEFPGFLDILCILALQVPLCRNSPNNSGTAGLYLSATGPPVQKSSRAFLCHP